MDTDFIPAVCPKCGGNLRVEPNADTLICQFCGTEHIIRRNVNGAVTLETYARCPLCKRNDRSEKISAILRNQTAQTEGVVTQNQVYTDSKGNKYNQTVNVPVKTVQISDLARHLSPPPRPPAQLKGGATDNTLLIAFILMVLGLVGIVTAIETSNDTHSSSGYGACGGFGVLVIILAVGLFIHWFKSRKEVKERAIKQQANLNNVHQQWQQAMSRWEKLYYCGRDDILYIPGENTYSSVADMLVYIYNKQAYKLKR